MFPDANTTAVHHLSSSSAKRRSAADAQAQTKEFLLGEQAGSEQASRCRPDQVTGGDACATVSQLHLLAAGQWNTPIYPEDETWRFVSGLCTDFSRRVGTPVLLTSHARGKVSECLFSRDSIQTLGRTRPSQLEDSA